MSVKTGVDWVKEGSSSLFMELKTGAAILEISMEIPQEPINTSLL